LVLWDCAENAELRHPVFSDVHDGCDITTAVAVVGSGPDGNNRLLGEVVLSQISIETQVADERHTL